jgi:chromosome partitioning protein
MRTIAVINQKGGCGKTITAINLSACLTEHQQSVLLVDLDPQGHASLGLGVQPEEVDRSLYHVLSENYPDLQLKDILIGLSSHLDLAPSGLMLAAVEPELAGHPGREDRLLIALAQSPHPYDYVIVDCPPSLGLLTFNALRACREIIVPVETSFFALHGLAKLSETIRLVEDRFGQRKHVQVLATIFDRRTKIANEVLTELRKHFGDRLLPTAIGINVRLREATGFGQPICQYDRYCTGYRDYSALAREILQQAQSHRYQTHPSPAVEKPLGPHFTDMGLRLRLLAPDANQVLVAGDFNDWQPDEAARLDHDGRGIWSTILPLKAGRYQYRYIVDGLWMEDPHNPHTVDTPYGVKNSVVEIQQQKESD